MFKKKISLVIPAFNEASRLPGFLNALTQEFEVAGQTTEIIIVDDGSREEDKRIYRDVVANSAGIQIKLIENNLNQGKGAALKQGFLAASGDWIGYTDADGATSAKEIVRLIKLINEDQEHDGILGSRIRMLGYSNQRFLGRHLSGRVFVTVMNLILNIPAYDPQCGCKFFRKDKLLNLVNQTRQKGYLFDIELIYLSIRARLNLIEVPISWHDVPGSKVNVISDGFKMFWGLRGIKKDHTNFPVTKS